MEGNLPSNEPSVDGEDLDDLGASSHLVDDQVLDQVAHYAAHNESVTFEEVPEDRVALHPSGRPKRAAKKKGRPMDQDYIFYE